MMTDTGTDLSFALTPADALTWEAQPQALRGTRLFAYDLWLAAGAGWLLLLPADWITGQLAGLLRLLLLVAVQIALASLAMSLAARRRARRRVPAPIEARLTERGPALLWQLSSAPAQEIDAAAIRQVHLTARHLLLDAPPAVVIVPVTAFPTAQAAQDFARRREARRAAAAS